MPFSLIKGFLTNCKNLYYSWKCNSIAIITWQLLWVNSIVKVSKWQPTFFYFFLWWQWNITYISDVMNLSKKPFNNDSIEFRRLKMNKIWRSQFYEKNHNLYTQNYELCRSKRIHLKSPPTPFFYNEIDPLDH